jgi:hypothetical protein
MVFICNKFRNKLKKISQTVPSFERLRQKDGRRGREESRTFCYGKLSRETG